MSLLVKALEKAAQDRNESNAARAPGAADSSVQTPNTAKSSACEIF